MKIVREDFIKNINQNFVDCMYSIFNNYAGGPAEFIKDKTGTSNVTKCFEKILQL